MKNDAFTVTNLSATVGSFSLKNIEFSLAAGEYYVLLGSSGSGKTTLLETLAGRYHHTTGSITTRGKDISYLPPEKRNIGFVYQNYELFPHLTVRDNIEFGLRFRKDKSINNIETSALSAMLGITEILDRRPRNLSGGEMQRVAVARALRTSPDILFFDEPLNALDFLTKRTMLKMISDIHDKMKFTAIHVTHDISEAALLSDQIGIMEKGRLVQSGTLAGIQNNPCCDFAREIRNFNNEVR